MDKSPSYLQKIFQHKIVYPFDWQNDQEKKVVNKHELYVNLLDVNYVDKETYFDPNSLHKNPTKQSHVVTYISKTKWHHELENNRNQTIKWNQPYHPNEEEKDIHPKLALVVRQQNAFNPFLLLHLHDRKELPFYFDDQLEMDDVTCTLYRNHILLQEQDNKMDAFDKIWQWLRFKNGCDKNLFCEGFELRRRYYARHKKIDGFVKSKETKEENIKLLKIRYQDFFDNQTEIWKKDNSIMFWKMKEIFFIWILILIYQ